MLVVMGGGAPCGWCGQLSEVEARVGEARAEVRAAEDQERRLTHEVNDIKARVSRGGCSGWGGLACRCCC